MLYVCNYKFINGLGIIRKENIMLFTICIFKILIGLKYCDIEMQIDLCMPYMDIVIINDVDDDDKYDNDDDEYDDNDDDDIDVKNPHS